MKSELISKLPGKSEIQATSAVLILSLALIAGCVSSGGQQQLQEQGNSANAQQTNIQQNSQDNIPANQQGFAIDSGGGNQSATVNGGPYENYSPNVAGENMDNSASINNVIIDENAPLNLDAGKDLGDLPPENKSTTGISNQNLSLNPSSGDGFSSQTNLGQVPSNVPPVASLSSPEPSPIARPVTNPQNIFAPEGTLTWVGYNYKKGDKKIDVQIVTSGSPAYRIFKEINRGGQSELVVRFLNTKLRKKVRRDIDASEFRSPVAYVRMRHDPSFVHTDVVMTLRDSIEPVITTKGSNLMFTFEIPEQWYAPKAEEKPVASAEIITDDSPGMSPVADSLPGEQAQTTEAFVNDPGKDAFSGKKDIESAPLIPKSESSSELIPEKNTNPAPTPKVNGNQLLKEEIEEELYYVRSVAQGDFSSDIPASGEFSTNSLLEDIPMNSSAVDGGATPTVAEPVQQADLIGVTPGASPLPSPSTKKALRLDFRDAPISQIIRMIANESNVNFIISPEAGVKKTSISMKNVPWDVALKAVLESNRLGMQEIAPGLVRIDFLKTFTEDRDTEEKARQATEALTPTKVLVMPLNYAKADDAVKLAQAMLPKPTDPSNIAQKRNYDRFKAQSDPRSNSVVVEATPNVLATIKTLLERLDAQTPQVRIASRLVEVSSEIADGLGVSWGTPVSFDPGRGLGFGTLPFPNYVTSDFAVDPGGAATAGGTAAFKFGSINNVVALDLRLRMYETRRQADTLHTQDVVVQDNEKATVTAGTSDFFVTSAGVGSSGGLAEVAYNLSLNVQPHITADGAVQMKIEIKDDSPAPSGAASASASKLTRQLTTTLLKRSGETAVIGGLYASDMTKVQRGVPILSRLPLIGALFRTNERKDTKKDLLIMVTPTIVGMSSSASGATPSDAFQNPVIPPGALNALPGAQGPMNIGAANQQNAIQQGSQQGAQQAAQQGNEAGNATNQNGLMQNGQSSNASLESNELN